MVYNGIMTTWSQNINCQKEVSKMDTLSQMANTNQPTQANGLAIQTTNLTKVYGQSRGISNLNLEVREGEVFGFLGPNGAGKTTTIRILLDLIKPTGGQASVLG